jgi:hypothetical protein
VYVFILLEIETIIHLPLNIDLKMLISQLKQENIANSQEISELSLINVVREDVI